MDRILKNIDQLSSQLANKRKESKDQKKLDPIIEKLSKYASTLLCFPNCESLTQHPRSLKDEEEKIKAMHERGFLVRLAHNSDDAEELVSSCSKIKDALHLFLVRCLWSF